MSSQARPLRCAHVEEEYRAGDANLAGSVNVSDFNIWNSNKFTLSDWVSDATLPGALNGLQTRESKQNDSSTRIADAVFGDWNN